MLPLERILWPTDFSEPSYRALKTADELAIHFSAELTLIHVIPPLPLIPARDAPLGINTGSYLLEIETQAKQTLEKIVAEKTSEDRKTRTLVGHGNPADEIVRAGKRVQADLIVIATHGLTGWRRFIFGSVAEKVIRTASCPVLSIQLYPEQQAE